MTRGVRRTQFQQRAHVNRDGARLTVPVKLESLKDVVVLPVYAEDDTFEAF